AAIVRGADTSDRGLTPESAGLYAAATGFQAISRDDLDNMARQFPMYDALYAYCQTQTSAVPPPQRVLFVCLHGAAKSVIAAAIVRGADTSDRGLTPESAGLYAAATGFQAISRDDLDNMARQFPMYDALYAYCQTQTSAVPPPQRVLFVCLHGAAKSVIAA